MGALASSRAREELRPRGHLCLYRGRLGFLGEIYHAFVGIRAGIFRHVCYPIVRSLAQYPEVRQRLWRNFNGASIK